MVDTIIATIVPVIISAGDIIIERIVRSGIVITTVEDGIDVL
jgi:hypothetical protein